MTHALRNSVILALTGGIACGKSEVGHILETLGFTVCDTDRVAHELMRKGCPVYQQVVESFGIGILRENGEIDRSKLGKIVFKETGKRQLLNSLVHPAVKEWLVDWLAVQAVERRNVAVQIPLLFESGLTDLWDAVICVSSNKTLVRRRLAKRGLSETEIEARIRAQLPLEEKEKRSDYVIYNNGTLEELRKQTKQIISRITAERIKNE